MKDHKSSVTCARFDNSGLFVISGSTDLKVYISSSYIPDIDDKHTSENESIPFTKAKFGEEIMSLTMGGWVNFTCWSPSSKYCFIASHDAMMNVINTSDQSVEKVYLSHSPLSFIIPVSDTLIYGVGYDRHIYQYGYSDDSKSWVLTKTITKQDENKVGSTESTGTGSVLERLKKFEGGYGKKQSLIVTTTVQNNIHSANINSANLVNGNIVTSDYAGFIKIWTV